MPELIAFVIVSIVVCYGLQAWGFYRGRKIMLFCNKILQKELDEANWMGRLSIRLADRFKQESAKLQADNAAMNKRIEELENEIETTINQKDQTKQSITDSEQQQSQKKGE